MPSKHVLTVLVSKLSLGRARFFFCCVGVLYVLSFAITLVFPNPYFWDDWLNYYNKSSTQIRASTGPFSGFSPWRLVAEGWLNDFWPNGFHLITFLLFPLAAFSLWKILSSSSIVTSDEAATITALFLLIPVNSARNAMTIVMYSSCYASFYVAWWLFARTSAWYLYLLSLILFVNSFDTASLILFSIVPVLLSVAETRRGSQSWFRCISRSAPLIVAAIGFWFIEPLLNPTLDEVRLRYYEPKMSGVVRGLVVGLILIVFSFLLSITRMNGHRLERWKSQLIIGFFLIWLGMFPYMTLGHFPNLESIFISFVPGYSDWDSRHQLLMPLGLAVLCVALLGATRAVLNRKSVLPLLLICSVLNLTFSQEYYLDSVKTRDTIREIHELTEINQFKLVLVDDQALRFNARGRSIRSYEWDGILQAALGNSAPKADVLRFVGCEGQVPDAIVTIQAANGKLRTLITGSARIKVSVRQISIC